jgi:predicted nucleic acid-binding protein
MPLYDLADPTVPLPGQLVADTSLLLALRTGDDNPHAAAAYRFIARLGQAIANRSLILWLPTAVRQECYHIILSHALRRTWAGLDPATRPANWLAAYKQQPALLASGFADLATFDEILASIPVTPASSLPPDMLRSEQSPDGLMLHFITTYHLLPQDALILAECSRLGVTSVATLDSDWRRVTEFDVYTVLPSLPVA